MQFLKMEQKQILLSILIKKNKRKMENKKDKMIDELIEITQKKKAEIEKAEKPTWLTNCLFTHDWVSAKTNIKTVSIVNDLVKMLATVIGKEKEMESANSLLGTKEKFDFYGFSKEDWAADIKTRIDQINVSFKRKELQEIESQLDSMISKERREELQLAAIMKKLKGETV